MKRNRFRVFAVIGAVALSSVGLAWSATAATTGNTTTTFTLTAGSLAITVPGSSNLGSVATGTATTSSQLGSIQVSDGRGALNGAWTTSVSSTDFTTGGATSDETIVKASADYWSGAATATSGTGTFTPGQANARAKVTMASSRTAFSGASVIGNNTATWNPTVIINIPSAAVAGAYSGTITHSVA
ncbi:MAG: hypothetical protein LC792_20265 [Actinobacteria bacterium]|nr:hypothetical protein [Actinomycetota bacterium]